MFIVYILQSESDLTFYTGMTDDLERRLFEHNTKGTKYTRAHGPWRLIHSEECSTREEAREREKYSKSGMGRERRNEMTK